MPNDILNQVLAHADAHRDKYLSDLFKLLRQPSISTQNVGMDECSRLLQQLMHEYGIEARIIPTAGHPVVYAELPGPAGAPTVLIYGHYDVQPPEPDSEWLSPPFEPTIRDSRVFARGAGDNKGQFWCHIAAIDAWLKTAGSLPVTVKLLIEGEEEVGSENLSPFLIANRDMLKADMVFWSDGWMHPTGDATVSLGARGNLYIELEAHGANRDLHSGNAGGNVPNPAWDLVKLLSTMIDDNGRVLIDGFYDNIKAPTPLEREALDLMPFNAEETLRDFGISEFAGPKDKSYYEKLMFWPTFTICGLVSGYTGEGSKTVLPHVARAKIDIRLVVDMDPDDIFRKVEAHVKRYAPGVAIRNFGGNPPCKTPIDHPYTPAFVEAARLGFRSEPVVRPTMGGSSPDYLFARDLGLPVFCIPYANADENNHAPNENIKVEFFYSGIRTSAALLATLAAERTNRGQ